MSCSPKKILRNVLRGKLHPRKMSEEKTNKQKWIHHKGDAQKQQNKEGKVPIERC